MVESVNSWEINRWIAFQDSIVGGAVVGRAWSRCCRQQHTFFLNFCFLVAMQVDTINLRGGLPGVNLGDME